MTTISIPIKETVTNIIAKKQSLEAITPHRICIGILVRAFCDFRQSNEYHKFDSQSTTKVFCALFLELMQNADLTLNNFINIITSMVRNNNQVNSVLTRFKNTIADINKCGTQALLDNIDAISNLICHKEKDSDQIGTVVIVHKSSVIGFYCRRLVVTFEKLSFPEITTFLVAFLNYSKDLINEDSLKIENTTLLQTQKQILFTKDEDLWTRRQSELFIATQYALLLYDEQNAMEPKKLHEFLECMLKANPDLAEAHFLNYLNYMRFKEYCGAIESIYNSFDKSAANEKNGPDEKPRTYRYAALNLALLHFQFGQEEEALEALNESIRLAQEANDTICLQHALTWLHTIDSSSKHRMVETCASKGQDFNKSYLKALGIQSFCLYASVHSGSPREIFETLSKADSHPTATSTCNQPQPTNSLSLTNTNNIQSANHAHALNVALYTYYGRPGLATLDAQLLLYQDAEQRLLRLEAARRQRGEPYAQALCTIAQQLHAEGLNAQAHAVLELAKEGLGMGKARGCGGAGGEMVCVVEDVIYFEQYLYLDKANLAQGHANNLLACSNPSYRYEGILRTAELQAARDDYEGAQSTLTAILDRNSVGGNATEDAIEENSPFFHHVRVRAMLLLVEIQTTIAEGWVAGGEVPQGVATTLQSALALARSNHLSHLEALSRLHTAHLLLLQRAPVRALHVLNHPRCLPALLSHGGKYDRARGFLLYSKCRIALGATHGKKMDKEQLQECIKHLTKVCDWFEQVGANWRVRDAMYILTQLFNEYNMVENRNEMSLQYRKLVEENPMRNPITVVTTV